MCILVIDFFLWFFDFGTVLDCCLALEMTFEPQFQILLISILFALIVKDKDDNHIKYDTVKLVAETKQQASSTWGSLKGRNENIRHSLYE